MISIKKIYQDILKTKKRYILITGGRNSSKSYSVCSLFTYLMSVEFQKILFTRYTLTSAEISIIPEFKEKIELMELQPIFKVTSKEIICDKTNSELIFKGIKSSSGSLTANLKSLQGITTWIYDEFEEQTDEKEFDKIDLSIRSNKAQNRIVMIMNPVTREHWIWQRWFENSFEYKEIDGFKIPVSTHPDICHIHTTYLDNIDNIPEQYLQQIQKIKLTDENKYKHVILGGWLEKAEGVIFDNWQIGEFDNSLPYGFGLDFGFSFDNDALIKVAIDEKRKLIYLKEEFYKNGTEFSILANILKNRCENKEIIADSAEDRLIFDLRKSGLNIKPCNKGKGSVNDGIKILKDYKLIVTNDSINLKKELNNYAWHDKKSETPIDEYNHLIDAARYYIAYKTKFNKPAVY